MRAVVTRVSSASVTIDGAVHGKIGPGFLILLGVGPDDTEQHALADCRKGRRPNFMGAAGPELGNAMYETFLAICAELGYPPQHGEFGACMQVESVNDGPVTLILDTDELMKK